MIIALKTDSPQATITVLDDSFVVVSTVTWEAHRTLARDLLSRVTDQLTQQKAGWDDVRAIILFRGPGSFTGLRISAAVANTIAHAQSIPIVGVTGDEWIDSGVSRIKNSENDQLVMPEYGAGPRITQQRK